MSEDKVEREIVPSQPEPEETKTNVPIRIVTQRVPVPTPQDAEALRAALEPHDQDGCIRDKESGAYVYIRSRAFLAFGDPNEKQAEQAAQTEADDDRLPLLVAPSGETLVK